MGGGDRCLRRCSGIATPTPPTLPERRAEYRKRGAQQRRRGAEYQDDPSQEVSLLFYRGFALEQMGEPEEAIADYEDCQASLLGACIKTRSTWRRCARAFFWPSSAAARRPNSICDGP